MNVGREPFLWNPFSPLVALRSAAPVDTLLALGYGAGEGEHVWRVLALRRIDTGEWRLTVVPQRRPGARPAARCRRRRPQRRGARGLRRRAHVRADRRRAALPVQRPLVDAPAADHELGRRDRSAGFDAGPANRPAGGRQPAAGPPGPLLGGPGRLGAVGGVAGGGTWAARHRPPTRPSAPTRSGTAEEIVQDAASTGLPLPVIGDFVVPPADGPPSRDFQSLHFDFGLPLVPVVPADIARFTALHVRLEASLSDAVTRLVPLRARLAGGRWPAREELIGRFAAYGASHGAREDEQGYVEGSLARIVEAATGPDLVELAIHLRPGELLVFDNLALADGRRGTRQPGELQQRVFWHRAVTRAQQIELREHLLAAFTGQ